MKTLEDARRARDIALMRYTELRADGVSFRRLAIAEKELTRLGDEVRRLEREAPTCTCTALTNCPEADRLHAALGKAQPGTLESHAANVAYLQHRAPFAPHLRPLLTQAEAR